MLTSILENKPYGSIGVKLIDGESYSYQNLTGLVDEMASKLSSHGVKSGTVVKIVTVPYTHLTLPTKA